MVDDLVTRLRICQNEYGTGDVCVEAADEIERLRLKCEHLESELARLERLSNG